MSAIRTVIGVSICLFAIPYAQKTGIKNSLKFFLIVLIAAQIHKSAYAFLAVYFVIKVTFSVKSSIVYIGAPMALLLFRSQFYGIINTYLKTVQESSISLGGNLLVYIGCMVLTVLVWIYYKRVGNGVDSSGELVSTELTGYFSDTGLAMRMIYFGIILQLFGTGTVLTRMAQYFQIFILVLVPNNLTRLDTKSRVIVKIILYILAIAYFVKYTLIPDPLDIVPYEVF